MDFKNGTEFLLYSYGNFSIYILHDSAVLTDRIRLQVLANRKPLSFRRSSI